MTLGPYCLRKAIPEDARTVLADIREDDAEEWALSVDGGLYGHLAASIEASAESYCIAGSAGEAHIIFGVVPPGSTWLLGTNKAQQDALWIMAAVRRFQEEFFKRWPVTVCYSAPHNVAHHRWLLWLGYRQTGERPWGSFGHTFLEFIRDTTDK